MKPHSQTQSTLTATKYRQGSDAQPYLLLCSFHTSLFIHPAPSPPSLTPPTPFFPPPFLVQLFPPVHKTSLRIDCLAVLMLNMHRISHLLSSAPSPTSLSLSLPISPLSSVHSRFPLSCPFLSCSVFSISHAPNTFLFHPELVVFSSYLISAFTSPQPPSYSHLSVFLPVVEWGQSGGV